MTKPNKKATQSAARRHVPVTDTECILDVLPDPVVLIDGSGLVRLANAVFEQLFGWTKSEILGLPLSLLMAHSEAAAREIAPSGYVHKEHGHCLMRSRPILAARKSGQLFPAELTISEFHQGGKTGFIGVFHDMRRIDEARKALNDNQERFALALSGTNEGIWDWDLQSGLVFYSERVRDLFGLERSVGTTNDWLACVHADDQVHYLAAVRTHLKGETQFLNIDYRLAGNERRWVRHRGLGLRDGSGRVFRMAGSVGDITETKLAEVKLRDTLAQVEAANRAKADFLAAMSHELRTPLNAIIGFSEMIHGQILGPVGTQKYVEYASDIMVSARHLLEIINDILEMARLEAGQTEFRPTLIDMTTVIETSLRLLHQRISHSGLTLAAKIAPNLPPILGDERRLKQVMINLLGNAIKFTPKEGLIVVEAKPVLDGRLMVRVIDSGVGIAERDIPRALAPFTQVDSVVARRYQGSGLGLPLAKAFVELHGGNLELSSILGKGTTVTLYFPAQPQHPQ
ncbi:MAG: PAS domain S-box protein [Alphaproteobacteria bacterium]|nr:PAS domain S-box protein [Alphaproteobacteria bacterium]